MENGEGDKHSRFLTRKEKWMLGVYTAAAVTSTVIFIVTLSLIAQLQNKNETKDVLQGFRNKITNLEKKLEEAIGKSNTRYHELLTIEGWTKLSNGLHYKKFQQVTGIPFWTASEKCEIQGARLASTGIRNATIRSEMSKIFSGYRSWIGLTQPYENTTWVWSDGKLYENTDMPWKLTDCSNKKGQYGIIYLSSSSTSLYCYRSIDQAWNYICEI